MTGGTEEDAQEDIRTTAHKAIAKEKNENLDTAVIAALSPQEDAIDRLLENSILVDLRSKNTDPEYNEATMELTSLKAAIQSLLAEARKDTVEALEPYIGHELSEEGIRMLAETKAELAALGGKSDE